MRKDTGSILPANDRGQSITDFVRELKSLAGTCEFTKEQLGDSLRDRFVCGLRSEQIKRKLLSANHTFQEAVDAAIAQETAQKDVHDLGSNSHGDNSSANVNRVKRDNFASRGRIWQAKWCKIQDRYFNQIQQQISHST